MTSKEVEWYPVGDPDDLVVVSAEEVIPNKLLPNPHLEVLVLKDSNRVVSEEGSVAVEGSVVVSAAMVVVSAAIEAVLVVEVVLDTKEVAGSLDDKEDIKADLHPLMRPADLADEVGMAVAEAEAQVEAMRTEETVMAQEETNVAGPEATEIPLVAETVATRSVTVTEIETATANATDTVVVDEMTTMALESDTTRTMGRMTQDKSEGIDTLHRHSCIFVQHILQGRLVGILRSMYSNHF